MTTSPSSIPPVTQPNKFSLQTLTGIAILGMLITGIWEFGGFRTNEQTFYYIAAKGGNYTLLSIVSALFERKMMALFAILFGAGIGLFLQKKEMPGSLSPTDAFIRNQLWLILFGLLNAFIFLWPNDLLYPFGIVGILLFAFWRMSAKGLFIASLCCLFIYSGKNFWFNEEEKIDFKKYQAVLTIEKKFTEDSVNRAKKDSLNKPTDTAKLRAFLLSKKLADSLAKKKDTLTSKQKEEKEKWEGTVKYLKYDSAKTVAENKAMRAGYSKIWFYIKGRSQNKESTWLYGLGVWYIGGMMFLGMALFRFGFFDHRFIKKHYLLIAIVSLLVGFTFSWLRISQTHASLLNHAEFLKSHLFSYWQFNAVEELFIGVGYISLVLCLLQDKGLQWLWISCAAIGRMALTNYVLQVVICSFLFYGYGLGFYGRFTQWELYFMVVEISLVQVVFSILWLRHFQKGPIEWLFYGLIYGKWTNKLLAAK